MRIRALCEKHSAFIFFAKKEKKHMYKKLVLFILLIIFGPKTKKEDK